MYSIRNFLRILFSNESKDIYGSKARCYTYYEKDASLPVILDTLGLYIVHESIVPIGMIVEKKFLKTLRCECCSKEYVRVFRKVNLLSLFPFITDFDVWKHFENDAQLFLKVRLKRKLGERDSLSAALAFEYGTFVRQLRYLCGGGCGCTFEQFASSVTFVFERHSAGKGRRFCLSFF